MRTLQTMLFPNMDVRADEEMYVRTNERCWVDMGRRAIHFEEGGLLHTDTFFNSISVGVWKRRCDVQSLSLLLCGEGSFVLSVGLHRIGQGFAWIAQQRISLQAGGTCRPLEAWPELSDGMLFFSLRALGCGVLAGGGYVTSDTPLRDVRIGLVITHFNRVHQVQQAIGRIRTDLLDRPDIKGRITLTVVDNSNNLVVAPHPAIEHVSNRNLGGTGGFVRGLLSLVDDASCTHALFMDDDASCEPDSLARCLALLQYARNPGLSIAGGLLREGAPWTLLEKGARFDGAVRAMKAGLDMRKVVDLLQAEREEATADYGAWWLYAFPLSQVRHWPFPFFVRGDDILFGLMNRFEVATLNGVACLGEDFSAKHGPMTTYLDARYHMVIGLMSAGGGKHDVLGVCARLFIKAIASYLYGSARAVTLAVQHISVGPNFFRDILTLDAVRVQIAAFSGDEKLGTIDRARLALKPQRTGKEFRLRRLARVLSLQGFLLPNALIRNRTTVQAKSFHGRASAVFRYRRVLYEQESTGQGFIAVYDRARFFVELRDFLKAWLSLMINLKRLRHKYATGSAFLVTEAFWRGVYADALGRAGAADEVRPLTPSADSRETSSVRTPLTRTP